MARPLARALQLSRSAFQPAHSPIAVSRLVFPSPYRIIPRATTGPRSFSSSASRSANYERFSSSGGRGGYEPPGGSGNPLINRLRQRLGGDRGLMLFGVGTGGAVVYYLFHLEQVPETGRWRFMDTSASTETQMGLQAVQQTLAQYQGQLLPASSPTTKRIKAVAKRIVESNGLGTMKDIGVMDGLPGVNIGSFFGQGGEGEGWEGASDDIANRKSGKDVEWETYVIKDDKTKNAFVLPGGKIFVFTGILPVCKNDDGLASVLGHEVAHQVARHSAERMSSAKVLFGLGYLLEILGLDVGVSRLLLTFLMQLPNSRTNESEADYIGVKLMSKACFDPRESTRMWTRMAESEHKGGGSSFVNSDFLSTHPANEKRIKQLEKWMPEALDLRAASPCGDTSSQYESFREHMPMERSERIWA